MALEVRKQAQPVLFALVAAFNALKKENIGTNCHADTTSTQGGDFTNPTSAALQCVSANASSLPTTITLANEAKAVYNTHLADAVAHKVADVANVIATANASDQTTANTLLNAIKAAYNLHRASTTYHYTADATNVVTAAAATDAGTSVTLANDIKVQVNAHIKFGIAAPSINLVGP